MPKSTTRSAGKSQLKRALEAEQIRRELARRKTTHFARYMFPKYQVLWFHAAIDALLDRVISGDCKRAMVFIQPRVGKSVRISELLPARYHGVYPDRHIIHASHTVDLAKRFTRRIKRIMRDEKYARVYPQAQIAKALKGGIDTAFEYETTAGGEYKAVGVGGAPHGRGGNLIIIDDPIKKRADAESETVRESTWEWYTGDIYSRRMNDDAAIIVMHTRFHEDDLAGRLLMAEAEGGEKWEKLVIPSILTADHDPHPDDPRDIGEALWPEVASLETLDIIKRQSPRDFASLYQQAPSPAGGDIFKREHFRYYRTSKLSGSIELFDDVDRDQPFTLTFKTDKYRRFIVVDGAWSEKTSSDNATIGVYCVVQGHLVLLDLWAGKVSAPEAVRIMKGKMGEWDCREVFVETEGGGLPLKQIAVEQGIMAKALTTRSKETGRQRDKEARAHETTGAFENHKVWFPLSASRPDVTPELEHELLGFPNAAHDDRVDNVMYAVEVGLTRAGSSIVTAGNPITSGLPGNGHKPSVRKTNPLAGMRPNSRY